MQLFLRLVYYTVTSDLIINYYGNNFYLQVLGVCAAQVIKASLAQSEEVNNYIT